MSIVLTAVLILSALRVCAEKIEADISVEVLPVQTENADVEYVTDETENISENLEIEPSEL